MTREEIVKLVIDTVRTYGSDAGERANPGSKLKSQAEYIADVLEEHQRLSLIPMEHFRIVLR